MVKHSPKILQSEEKATTTSHHHYHSVGTASNKKKNSEGTAQSCRKSHRSNRHDQNQHTVIHKVPQATRTSRVKTLRSLAESLIGVTGIIRTSVLSLFQFCKQQEQEE